MIKRSFTVSRFTCVERIATGPLGETWRAKAHGIAGVERSYAVQRLHPHIADDASTLESVLAAAVAYRELEHDGLVQLHEIGRKPPIPFLAYDFIEGLDLSLLRPALLQHVPASGQTALELLPHIITVLGQELAETLAYAHERGALHLSLHPRSVLIDERGAPRTWDLGLLRPLQRGAWLDVPSLAVLLPYAAPEVQRGDAVDGRADVFSLGAVLHELLTGTPGEHDERAPPSLPGVSGPTMEQLGQVLLKALAVRPADRHASMGELLQGLLGVTATRDAARAALRSIAATRRGWHGRPDALAEAPPAHETAPDVAAQPAASQATADPLPPPPGVRPDDVPLSPAAVSAPPLWGAEPQRITTSPAGALIIHQEPAQEPVLGLDLEADEEEYTVPVAHSPRSQIIVIEAESPNLRLLRRGPMEGSDETPLPSSVPLLDSSVPDLEVTRVPSGAYPISVPGWQGNPPPSEPVLPPLLVNPSSGPLGLGLDSGPVLAELPEQCTQPETPAGRATNPSRIPVARILPGSVRRASRSLAVVSTTVREIPALRPPVERSLSVEPFQEQEPSGALLQAYDSGGHFLPPRPAAQSPPSELALAVAAVSDPPSVRSPLLGPSHHPTGPLADAFAPIITAPVPRAETAEMEASALPVQFTAAEIDSIFAHEPASVSPVPPISAGSPRSAPELSSAPATPPMAEASGPEVAPLPPPQGVPTTAVVYTPSPPPPRRWRRRRLLAIVGSALCLGVGVALLFHPARRPARVETAPGSAPLVQAPPAPEPKQQPRPAPMPPVPKVEPPVIAATPPVPAVVPAGGELVVKTTPVAAVFVDGQVKGATPLSMTLEEGTHQLLLVAEKHALWRGEVQGGAHVQVDLTPIALPTEVAGRAGLKVRCAHKHMYRIYVDGHDSGWNCPTGRLQVSAGAHHIEFMRFSDGSRQVHDVVVKTGGSSKRLYTKL